MASFGETLRSALVADAAVVACVSGRIFPNVIKQGVTMPAVRYFVVDELPWNTLDGGITRRGARVQVDAYARTYLAAQGLADALEGAVRALNGPAVTCLVISRRDSYEDSDELHRVSVDVSMSMDVSGT